MIHYNSIIQHFEYNGYQFSVLRLDLIHPEISGNKWFKLKYNLEEAKKEHKNTIITFGGAFSNHIAAAAFACKEAGLKSIGIIRGEISSANNPTLSMAQKNGMKLQFVSREEYRLKNESSYLEKIKQQVPNSYIIPEGGNNELGQRGCEEILTNVTNEFEQIFCAYGTGTTFKGIAKSLKSYQKLFGTNVLNYEAKSEFNKAQILNNYHFSGYAKHTIELLEFKKWFEENYHVPLDYVYTAKLFFAAFDMMNKKQLDPLKKILIIHSGGIQGNKGYEERYKL